MRLTRTETNLNEAEQRNKQMVDQATKVKKEHTNLVIPNDPYLLVSPLFDDHSILTWQQ
jgi:hypothetical protein